METFNSWQGKIVLGAQLNELGLRFVKITNERMNLWGLQYHIGENISEHNFSINDPVKYGIEFYPINVFANYFNRGNGFHYVTFADDERIYIGKNECVAKRIVLSEKINFVDMSKSLCMYAAKQNGLSIRHMSHAMRSDYAVCSLALENNKDSVWFIGGKRRRNYMVKKLRNA